MDTRIRARYSLKTRITLGTLLIFLFALWTFSYFSLRLLREDMQHDLAEQQVLAASYLAAEVNTSLADRLGAMETVAADITPALFGDLPTLQTRLSARPVFQKLFNGGTLVFRADGTMAASHALLASDSEAALIAPACLAAVIKSGRSMIGCPDIKADSPAPVFGLAVPIRDDQGKVIGALVGLTRLVAGNFLDRSVQKSLGRTGVYVFIADARQRVIVASSDRSRVMEKLPEPGKIPLLDGFFRGIEGSGYAINTVGIEVFASAKMISPAGWFALVALPAAHAFEPIRAMQNHLLLATLLFTLGAGALIWWLVNHQLSPLLSTAQALARMADSDYPLQPLPIKKQDEIGELVSGFNRLLQILGGRELDLKESEENLSITFHAIGDGVISTDEAGLITRMNPVAERLTGWPIALAKGRPLTEVFRIINAHSRQAVANPVQFVLAHGKVIGLANHTVLLARNGPEYQIADSAAPILNADGKIIGVVLVFSDVSERYRMEAAVHESEARYRMLFQEMLNGFALHEIICDAKGAPVDYRYLAVNPAFLRMTGLVEEAVIGHTVKTLLPNIEQHWIDTFGSVALSGKAVFFENYAAELGKHFQVTAFQPAPGQFACIFADVTEQKHSQAELARHRDHLEEEVLARTRELALAKASAEAANIAKSGFLSHMSHEIRTPMNAIMGMANLIRRSGVTPTQTEYLDKINTASHHLLGTLNDILDLSKIEAGKFILEAVPLSLTSVISNVQSILAEPAQAKGVLLHVDTLPMCSDLQGDPTRLQQALLNYANNAIKFTERGQVVLRVILEEESADAVILRFEVEDTGMGLSPETLARLFSAFEQADNSTPRKYGGTGLGLVITRRLAELMGGAAGATSSPGVGSTFWFTVCLKKIERQPEIEPLLASPESTVESRIRAGYQGRRILLVDDEPVNLFVTQSFLEETGLRIDTAEDGLQAVAMAEAAAYAVILMDIQMPSLNGLEATREIRQLQGYATTPIIAMTANAFAEDKARCLAAGMDDFLAKPFEPEALLAMLLGWLEKR